MGFLRCVSASLAAMLNFTAKTDYARYAALGRGRGHHSAKTAHADRLQILGWRTNISEESL